MPRQASHCGLRGQWRRSRRCGWGGATAAASVLHKAVLTFSTMQLPFVRPCTARGAACKLVPTFFVRCILRTATPRRRKPGSGDARALGATLRRRGCGRWAPTPARCFSTCGPLRGPPALLVGLALTGMRLGAARTLVFGGVIFFLSCFFSPPPPFLRPAPPAPSATSAAPPPTLLGAIHTPRAFPPTPLRPPPLPGGPLLLHPTVGAAE